MQKVNEGFNSFQLHEITVASLNFSGRYTSVVVSVMLKLRLSYKETIRTKIFTS